MVSCMFCMVLANSVVGTFQSCVCVCGVCVCVCVCVRTWRACVGACVRKCVRVCVRACVCA